MIEIDINNLHVRENYFN